MYVNQAKEVLEVIQAGVYALAGAMALALVLWLLWSLFDIIWDSFGRTTYRGGKVIGRKLSSRKSNFTYTPNA